MRIPSLPQVLFDEFPTDEDIKVCIFTRPYYSQPFPDLSHRVGNLIILCTETTFSFMAHFPRKLPHKLFHPMPILKDWMKINELNVAGLEKAFAFTCISTGDIVDSVMLLGLVNEKTDGLVLYTGFFKECKQALINDLIWKFKTKISDIYVDNSMAGSYHCDVMDCHEACEGIKNIIDKYSNYKIHLEMELFESLEILVELADYYRINVKLHENQQLLFHRTKYKDLFEYDSPMLSNIAHINNAFQLRNRPKIEIHSIKMVDISAYEKDFLENKIIHIRFITSELKRYPSIDKCGFTYVKYASHAGAHTLAELFDLIRPQRVHPMIEIENDPLLTITGDILNEGCQIVHNLGFDPVSYEVSLSDLSTKSCGKRSFLEPSTILSGTLSHEVSEIMSDDRSNTSECTKPAEKTTNIQSEIPAEVEDREIEVIVIDSDSDSDDEMQSLVS